MMGVPTYLKYSPYKNYFCAMQRVFTLLLLLAAGFIQGQVNGKITDAEENPLPGAAVSVYDNDKLVTGTTTDFEGQFSLPLRAGSYRLEISYISFQTLIKNITVPQSATIDLGTIGLLASTASLQEVTVTSTASMMELKQDKRIFNVAADVSSKGSNASDILNNVPSVSVDVEGNVSLRGSENVRILIDGKPSGLVGTDPATALRLLQGSMIERIEVITNPSARYDAEGEAGIINIVLKKDQRKGINGTFEVNAGYPQDFGASAGINYRTGKFNWFANGGINYRRSPGGGFTNQEFYLPQVDSSFRRNSTRQQIRGGSSATLRFGADYSLTPTQTLTGTFLYRPSLAHNRANIDYDEYNGNDELVSQSSRVDEETETGQTLEADLHYEKQFKGKDHKLTADFKFQDSDDREQSDITQTFAESTRDLLQKVYNQEDEQTILFQLDYVKPFTDTRKMEVGAKATFRDIINDYGVSERDTMDNFVALDRFTNDFRYLENIYAGYLIYSDAYKKINYQLGLRAEYSDITTELIKEQQTNNKQYINFFPSAFFTYKINKVSDWQLNYSRRISRPWFRALLPFSSYSDNVNLWGGNPDLDPEYTDSYETGYLRYLNKGSIYAGVYYRHRTNVTERIQLSTDSGTTVRFPVNLAVQDAYGLEFNLNLKPLSWYSLNLNANLYNAITTGSYEGVDYGNTNLTTQGRLMNRFTFWNSDLQLSLNFMGPRTTAQGRTLGIYTADLGWSKDVLKDNATITLSVRDLFNTRKRRGYTNGENFNSYGEFQWRQRQLMLTFTYRLNQKKSRQPRSGGGMDGEMDTP
jgi:outer membrane receptor protein involved in Fe transport